MFGASAPAAWASLSVPSTQFTAPSPSYATAAQALAQFEAAAGGADNGTAAGGQGGGFRHWAPAGIPVDGSDPGSTAIPGGHTAALSPSRLQPWGVELGPQVAVANDGFNSVNSNAGPIHGFNPADLWAPFNSNTTTLGVVVPTPQTGTPVPAMTRGLGVAFVHVENSSTTISYYSGDGLIGQVTAPQGATSFAGVLFRDPVVTHVVITLGTAAIFGFDGSSVTPGTTASSTLAAGNDVVLAEPGAGEVSTTATAGVPVSPVLESFDANEPAADITASIDWGDGTRSSGSIAPGTAGGFAVTGTHSYPLPGRYTATVTVRDFSGSELTTQALFQVAARPTATNVTCSPSAVAVSASTMCTATVMDLAGTGASAPSGAVTFSSPTPGAVFPGAGSCVLGPIAAPGTSQCSVLFEPGQLPPAQARVLAAYGGDADHGTSGATGVVAVHLGRCSLQAISRRLRAGAFGVLVTCDARTNVSLLAQARVTRKRRLRAFQLRFGLARLLVTAGRPTVLVIRPERGVLPPLRAALHRGQRVWLRLTLTATSHGNHLTTTKRVVALRF